VIRRITEFNALKEIYEAICMSIAHFLNYQIARTYRIVFDVEVLPDDKCAGYPAMLPLDDVDAVIFNLDSPGEEIFRAAAGIGKMSIREGFFEQHSGTVIAAVAAAKALREVFGSFDPLTAVGDRLPPGFAQLWLIETRFTGVLARAIRGIQEAEFDFELTPQENWATIVANICHLAHRDFTLYLSDAGLGNVELPQELQGLPLFP
jgi:hypothetical protein